MITVKQVLQDKGNPELWTISPNTTVYDALKMLSDKRVGALPVVEHEKLVGILSERDYARKVILKGKSSLNTPVREIMTEKVFCVEPEESMQACMELMTEKRVRHLPVLTGASSPALSPSATCSKRSSLNRKPSFATSKTTSRAGNIAPPESRLQKWPGLRDHPALL